MTFEASRQRALLLYKEWLREIPRSIRKYPLDFTIHEGRLRVRAEFERFRHLKNLEEINRIILKGKKDFPYFVLLFNRRELKFSILISIFSFINFFLGTMELIETHNKWKQRMHIMRLYEDMNNDYYSKKQSKRELERDIFKTSLDSHNQKQGNDNMIGEKSFLKKFLNSQNK